MHASPRIAQAKGRGFTALVDVFTPAAPRAKVHAVRDKKAILADIRTALQSLVADSFPKQCSCGKVYKDLDEFLAGTTQVPKGSVGLIQSSDDAESPVANLIRNCSCGSTLMAVFNERRDNSKHGRRTRETFDRLLVLLEEAGLERKRSRQELLNVLQGRDSPVLEATLMGEDVQPMLPLLAKLGRNDTKPNT